MAQYTLEFETSPLAGEGEALATWYREMHVPEVLAYSEFLAACLGC